jgi:hypothetical protein
MSWSRKLLPPLVLKDGHQLETLGEACDMILRLPKGRHWMPHWKQAAELLLIAVDAPQDERRSAIDRFRSQLSLAISRDGSLTPVLPGQ